MKKKDIVILSTADWNNPIWTNKQHVAVELTKEGYHVFYINSLGLRRIRFVKNDVKRILFRIKHSFSFPKQEQKNIWVWSPIILPFHNNKLINKINYFLFNLLLKYFLSRLKFKYNVLWTYNPLTLRFVSSKLFKTLVYHCVDEISEQPFMPINLIRNFEKQLVKQADIIFTTSKNLFKTRKALNANTYYFNNVVDYDHFSKALDDKTVIPEELLCISGPIIGFVGVISNYKLDLDLLYYIAITRPNWSFVFIGSVGEENSLTNINLLKKLSNVYFLGYRLYTDLPLYLKAFDVAILPCIHNEYTKNMFPMKFFEYLAAGKPIVSTKLDALEEFKHLFYEADSKEDFLNGLDRVLSGDVPPLEERLKAASEHTYESRMKKMLKIIEKKL